MIKLKSLLFEQTTNFRNEFVADLTAAGFKSSQEATKDGLMLNLTKAGMIITFTADRIIKIIFPHRVDIKNMGSDNIQPDLAAKFTAYDDDNQPMALEPATEEDKEFLKTLNRKDRPDLNNLTPQDSIHFVMWRAVIDSYGQDVDTLTTGATKQTAPVNKYINDLIKLGNIAQKWETFTTASLKDKLSILKSTATTVGQQAGTAAKALGQKAGAAFKGAISKIQQ